MKRRVGLIVSIVAVSATFIPGIAGLSTAGADPLADPVANLAPSFTFTSVCDRQLATGSAELDACIHAAIPDFDAAHASEGLPPIVLPDDFDQLSPAEQLLAVTDVERADRGLTTAAGLSSALSPLVTGSGPGTVTGDTPSALLAVYDWLYDDAGSAWADRHSVLAALPGPVVMGASAFDGAVAEQLSGGDFTHQVDVTPTWNDIASTITFALVPANTALAVDTGQTGSLTVTVTSGETGELGAEVFKGSNAWSISGPATCAVVPAQSCTFTLVFDPPGPGDYPGILVVTDGLFAKTTALAGREVAPALTMTLSANRVRPGHTLVVHGLATDALSNALLRGVSVTLQRRIASGYPWQTQAASTSGPRGRVTFRLQPLGTASYRLVLLGPTGTIETKTPPQKARVTS